MYINKKFVNVLAKGKQMTVGEIILQLGILLIDEKNVVKNLNKKMDILEEIFFTVDFLEENKLIDIDYDVGSLICPQVDPSDFEVKKEDPKYTINRLHAVIGFFQKYWSKRLTMKPLLLKYVRNGYRTNQELKDTISFWLPILVAILSSALTTFFSSFVSSENITFFHIINF